RARVTATVTWEDCDRPPHEMYFETDEQFATALSFNPNAFLTACVLPAMRHGEERVLVEGQVCPELLDGLTTAMAWIRYWSMPHSTPVYLAVQDGFERPRLNRAERAAS